MSAGKKPSEIPLILPAWYNGGNRKEVEYKLKGTIKTKTDRGFGFISREGETKDLFFHSKDLVGVTFDELQVGAVVTFDVVETEKGLAAKNVKLAQ